MKRLFLILSALGVFAPIAFAQAPVAKPTAQSASVAAPPASSSPVPVASSTPVPASDSTTASAPATPAESPKLNTKSASDTAAAPAAKGAVVLPPEKANPVTVPKFETPPVIDGKLDEPVWQKAAV